MSGKPTVRQMIENPSLDMNLDIPGQKDILNIASSAMGNIMGSGPVMPSIPGISFPTLPDISKFGDPSALLPEIPSISNLGDPLSLMSGVLSGVPGVGGALSGALSGVPGVPGVGGALSSVPGTLSGVSGALSSVSGALSGYVGGVVSGVTGAVGATVSDITDAVTGALPKVPGVGAVLSGLGDPSSLLTGALSNVPGVGGALSGAFSGAIPGALAGAIPTDLPGALSGAFSGAFPGALSGVLPNNLTNALPGGLGASSRLSGAILGEISGALPGALGSVLGGVSGIGGMISGPAGALAGLAGGLGGVAGGLGGALSGALGGALPGVTDALGGMLGGLLPNMLSGIDNVAELLELRVASPPSAVDIVKEFASKCTTAADKSQLAMLKASIVLKNGLIEQTVGSYGDMLSGMNPLDSALEAVQSGAVDISSLGADIMDLPATVLASSFPGFSNPMDALKGAVGSAESAFRDVSSALVEGVAEGRGLDGVSEFLSITDSFNEVLDENGIIVKAQNVITKAAAKAAAVGRTIVESPVSDNPIVQKLPVEPWTPPWLEA